MCLNLRAFHSEQIYSTPRKFLHRQICVSVHGSLLQNILYTAFYSKIRISLDANPRRYLICSFKTNSVDIIRHAVRIFLEHAVYLSAILIIYLHSQIHIDAVLLQKNHGFP